MSTAKRRILVTSALPYANGPIHLGHLVEYVQTDIWVRYHRIRGEEIYYVCADDAHGTPIMLKARAEGVTPEVLIERVGREHRADFEAFHVLFDNYHSTHSEENREYAERIYRALNDGGHIVRRTITQAFDPSEQIFLPDRFVKGECPRCGSADQHGDSCEVCGATYAPTDLKNPVSALSGVTPIEKSSEHLFFKLGDYEQMLKDWTAAGHLQPEVRNKLSEWFTAGLKDWDISRDAPYFGFKIPGEKEKYFYVWLDAPIGYMASFRQLCDRSALDFDDFWAAGSDAELYHFIGKDILYFHALFWPAMLEGAGFRKPTAIFAHGFLTVNGQKMSKSRGTFITARDYRDHLDPDWLRYYFAARLNARVEDIDLNLEDFVQKINTDLVGKVVNIAARCAGFLEKRFDRRLGERLETPSLLDDFISRGEAIGDYLEKREYSKAMREVMDLADLANQYINDKQPWVIAKQPENDAALQEICTQGINLFRILMVYLAPVVPALAERSGQYLGVDLHASTAWADRSDPLLDHTLNPFHHLMPRVEPKAIEQLIDASKAPTTPPPDALEGEITIDQFSAVDLRIARIVNAARVDGADKLLELTLDLGEDLGRRTVFAGIRSAYDPDDLVNRLTVVVANLKPRKMRFGTSEGMVLAAGPGSSDIWLIGPDEGALPGMRVR